MKEEISGALAQLKALISELCKEDTVNSTVWLDLLDKAVQLCENLPLASASKDNQGTLVSELESSAVSLWNFSVALKTKGTTSSVSNAKIRHIAFCGLYFSGTLCDEENDSHWKRQVMVPPVSNSLDRDQAQHFILPDLGPNCLKSRLRWYTFTSIVPDMSED